CTDKVNKQSRKKQNQVDSDEASSDDGLDHKCRCLLGKDTSSGGLPTMQWQSVIELLEQNTKLAFELHTYVNLNGGLKDLPATELIAHGTKEIWSATGYRFIYKKKWTSKEMSSMTVYTYYCVCLKVLETFDGIEVDIIAIPEEKGISSIAFVFKEVLAKYGAQIAEIAMDSTWKTNNAGYELYGIVGEANGQALALAFAFTALIDGGAEAGAKDRMLQKVLEHIRRCRPGIWFAHSNKDKCKINAIHKVLPWAWSQLCSWHAIRYLRECLAEDKVPTKYDPRRAHKHFDFIVPTWVPGVDGIICTQAVEDGVHEDDLEVENDDTLPATQPNENAPPATQPLPSTCRPPVLILVTDGIRQPIWPNPPKIKKSELPIFCSKEH
ncbi:hypothetical protein DXG01_001260, partial [Tephrocybe rancida]